MKHYDVISIMVSIIVFLGPFIFSVIKYIGIRNNNKMNEEEKREARKKLVLITITVFLIITAIIIAIFMHLFGNNEEQPTSQTFFSESTSMLETSMVTTMDVDRNTITKTTKKMVTSQITSELETETTNIVSNTTVNTNAQDKTVLLMDIENANNCVFHLIGYERLIFSQHGTCVYPLNKKFSVLNMTMKVEVPIKKNTSNFATLTIKADGNEIYSLKIDRHLKKQDISIDVSQIDTLTFTYEEVGAVITALGFVILKPTLIYK